MCQFAICILHFAKSLRSTAIEVCVKAHFASTRLLFKSPSYLIIFDTDVFLSKDDTRIVLESLILPFGGNSALIWKIHSLRTSPDALNLSQISRHIKIDSKWLTSYLEASKPAKVFRCLETESRMRDRRCWHIFMPILTHQSICRSNNFFSLEFSFLTK